MHVRLVTTFRASKKEPLAVLLERIHAAFLSSGLGEPAVQVSLSDAPVPGFVSSVDRVLKRYPILSRFESRSSLVPGTPPIRRISNGPESPVSGEAIEFSTLLVIAAWVPRSFPFHNFSVHFQNPSFGLPVSGAGYIGATAPGVIVGDSWWVNGRMRSVTAVTSVEAGAANKKLPSPPESVAAVLSAGGKAKSITQIPMAEDSARPSTPQPASASPEIAEAVRAVVLDFRARLPQIFDRANLPHEMAPALEALRTIGLGEATGPKKPVLVRAFKPLGYDCRGDSGTFTLRRRTPGNLTVQIDLDVGTWSQSLSASFSVMGLGFRARLPLGVSKHSIGGQYKIGNAEHWHRLVDNLAALVAELDRSFVPAVETASGPSPEWFTPEQS
jgi:hypothetical protein